jgi:hypothetical protein
MISPPADRDVERAEIQGRLAAALPELAHPELVWPLFVPRDDPSLRTEVIQFLPEYGIDPAP